MFDGDFVQGDLFGPPPGERTRILVFDLETQKSFEEVGGGRKAGELLMSVGVILDLGTGKFEDFTEEQVHELTETLLGAKKVIGYNVREFDLRVLEPYTIHDISRVRVLDLMEDIARVLGRRVALDAVADATLGRGKTGHGLEAIEWFRRGEMEKLVRYCRDDVQLTADLYIYGRDHGHVKIKTWDATQEIPVRWD